MAETLRLPPFPDAVVEARDLGRALAHLRALQLPRHLVCRNLQRYAELAELQVPPELYARIRDGSGFGYY